MSPLVCANLRRLTISFPPSPSDAIALLATADLPHLEALAFLNGGGEHDDLDDLEEFGKLAEALLCYASRLKEFTLGFAYEKSNFALSSGVWSSFKVLHTLTMDCSSDFASFLPILSAPLLRLRLRPPYHGCDGDAPHDILEA